MKRIILLPLLLCSGCGLTLTISGLKAGLIDRAIIVKNEEQIVSEDFIGLQIQWLPDFTWTDVKHWFKKEEQPEAKP